MIQRYRRNRRYHLCSNVPLPVQHLRLQPMLVLKLFPLMVPSRVRNRLCGVLNGTSYDGESFQPPLR